MIKSSIWLGTEESFLTYLRAEQYRLGHPDMEASMRVPAEERDDEYESYLIQKEGSVGMVNINGPMVAEDSWVNELFGLVSYPEISRALQELAEDDDVSTILLNLDSGGGDAAGLEGASDAVKWAMERKPVEAHTSGGMLSAAYWLGATARSVTMTKMAEVGSIGVLLVHRSMYEALKEDGIEYTVIRAGKYKALGHPAEKLSDEAKQIMQDKADTLYSFFLNHVSTERSELNIAQKGAWAEGLTFFGEEAIQLGLADRLMSLSDRVESIDYVDKHSQGSNNNGTIMSEVHEMPKGKTVVLRSDADKAALENGASLEDLDTSTVEDEEATEVAASETVTTETADTGESQEPVSGAPEAGLSSAAHDSDDALVEYLKDQNAKLSDQVAELKSETSQLKAELADTRAAASGLRSIAELHIHRMQIPLNVATMEMKDLPDSTVVAQHGSILEQFDTKFKVSQQSRPVEQKEDAGPAGSFRNHGIVAKS